VSSEEF
jgi:hypothetical protein